VDPVAARLAKKSGIKAIVIGGKDLANFGNLLSSRNFRGSIIE
jgi:uridylate kinase